MKIQLVSDTHGYHRQLKVNKNIDAIVHSGDCTKYKNILENEPEFNDFAEWFRDLEVKHKFLCAGNHDCSLLRKYNKDKLEEFGIIYLEHDYYELEGKLFFGSPYTPTFGDWFFMVGRHKIDKYWDALEPNIDLCFTHGMPYGILDATQNRFIDYVGDKALLKQLKKVQPRFYSGGHIHNGYGIENYGSRTIGDCKTVFMNNSLVEDGMFSKGLVNHGQIIEI